MQAIETVRSLLDEIPVLAEISKDMPFPYNVVIRQKIKEFNTYLTEIHTKEIQKQERKKRTKK
ncbi:hypothetical protein [Daejeonia sp. YH14]|uniref:hypothetical protein n=1 Tax=Daejeonia sp. YH14 TaxID=3439042 RepID=UPI003F493F4B